MHVLPLAVHDAVLKMLYWNCLFFLSKYLTKLKCQFELLAVRLYADFDSSLSIERVGAFRSVKGPGPTIEIKIKTFGIKYTCGHFLHVHQLDTLKWDFQIYSAKARI